MTKFRFSILLIISMLAVALAACAAPTAAPAPTTAPQSSSAAAQPTAAPKASASSSSTSSAPSGAANTLVIAADISDMISVDPAVSYEFSGDLMAHQAYETLVKFEGADLSNIKPGLATKWDIKDANDHWEITFTLRDGAKFASGNSITADDVVYSIQRAISLNKSPAFLFTDIAQMKADSVKAVDPKTVLFSLPKTASPQGFLSIMTFTIGGIIDSKQVKEHVANNDFGSAWLLDKSAGSGPYVIDHWTKEVEVSLKANPNSVTKPAVANILVKHIADANNQLSGLQKGDIDIARNLSPEQIASLKGKTDVTTAKGDSLLLVYVGMNVAVKPLDNADVREALRMAVDYDGIVNSLLSGNAKKVQNVIPAGLAGYNADTPFQKNVDAAKQLLTKAGQDKGFTVELLVPTGQAPGGAAYADIAAKLQADWKAIGVTVNIKQTTQAELLGSYRAQKGQLTLILWGPDFPDPDANAGPFSDYAAKSIAFRNSWDDKAAAQQARDAALITDPAKRAAAYKTLTDYILHKGPYVILYQPSENFGLRSTIKGFVWSAIGWSDFWTISK